jgi:hypothetical protein
VRLIAAARQQLPAAQIEARATDALGRHVMVAMGFPGVVLPPDVAGWAGVIAATIGLASMATGPCGGYFTAILGSEIGLWVQLLTIATAPPEARTPKAVTAAVLKATSSYAALQLVPTCIAVMAGAGPTLTAFIDLVMALGMIVYWSSTAALAVYGLDYAINYWTS